MRPRIFSIANLRVEHAGDFSVGIGVGLRFEVAADSVLDASYYGNTDEYDYYEDFFPTKIKEKIDNDELS